MGKVDPAVVQAVRVLAAGGLAVREIAQDLDVSLSSVYRLLSADTHAAMSGPTRGRRYQPARRAGEEARGVSRGWLLDAVAMHAGGCWTVPGGPGPRRTLWLSGRHMSVQRAAWLLLVGPLSTNERVRRRCSPWGQAACMAPDHLTVGRVMQPAAPQNAARRCLHGHLYDAVNTAFKRTRAGNVTRACRICRRCGSPGRVAATRTSL